MRKILIVPVIVLVGVLGFNVAKYATAENAVNTKATVTQLKDLSRTAIDGQKGFKTAADLAVSSELKARFAEKSAERGSFAQQIQDKLRQMGEPVDEKGSLKAAAGRAWMDLTTAVSKNDDKAVLGAVKSGEEKALEEYRDALKKELPQDVRKVVERQTQSIESSYDWTVNRLANTKIEIAEQKFEEEKDKTSDKRKDQINDLKARRDEIKDKYKENADDLKDGFERNTDKINDEIREEAKR